MSGIFEQALKTDNKSGNSIQMAFSGSGIDVAEKYKKWSDDKMTKREIENAIIQELKVFTPKINSLSFDKALPLLQKEAWRLADKYDTDGANVINLMLSRFGELKNED